MKYLYIFNYSRLTLGVARIVEHPSYDTKTNNYDFSLLKLKSKVNFAANSHIRPVRFSIDKF